MRPGVCFFVRRGAHRVRAVLDLVLGLLCVVGGVALYYLGMYNDAFTIRDFWRIRTAGWIGLAVVVLVTVWQVVKATRRSVSARRAARQAERDEKTRQKELEDARTRAVSMNKKSAPGGGTFFIPYQSLREHFSASMASTTIRAYRASPGSATSMV